MTSPQAVNPRFRNHEVSRRLFYGTPVGVTAIVLLVLFALFTVASVDFEASRVSPQKRSIFSEDESSLPKAAEVSHNAWEAKEGPKLHSGGEAPKNASFAGFQPNPASVGQNVTTLVRQSGVESGGLGDRHVESGASALVEEADDSSDWDVGWGAESPIEDSDALVDEEESSEEAEPVEESDNGPIDWKYDVCLLVKIGRKGGARPNVPFAELYRLFNAAKGAPNGSEPWKTLSERRLYVGTDFADILCLMVRDDLGPQVECTTYNRFGVKTNQVNIGVHQIRVTSVRRIRCRVQGLT